MATLNKFTDMQRVESFLLSLASTPEEISRAKESIEDLRELAEEHREARRNDIPSHWKF